MPSNIDDSIQEIRDGDDQQNLAIENMNLEIQPGERVAICGRTGRYIVHVFPLNPVEANVDPQW
jgi:hypothetical protein